MERIFKKLIAIIILILMMFASCSQTIILTLSQISWAENATEQNNINAGAGNDNVYKLGVAYSPGYFYNGNGNTVLVTYKDVQQFPYRNKNNIPTESEIANNTYKINYGYDRYCLRRGAFLSSYYEDVSFYKSNFENTNSDTQINNQYLFYGNKSTERNSSREAIIWLTKNSFPNDTHNGDWDKSQFRNNLIEIMNHYNENDDNYKNVKDLDGISDALIQVVQRFAFWNFTYNQGYTSYNRGGNPAFVDDIKISGQDLNDNQKIKAKALYVALIRGAEAHDEKYSLDQKEYKIDITKSKSAFKYTYSNNTYNYTYGPIKINFKNAEDESVSTDTYKIKSLTGTIKINSTNLQSNNIKYITKNGVEFNSDELKNHVNEEITVKFSTTNEVEGNITYLANAEFKNRLSEYKVNLYTRSKCK